METLELKSKKQPLNKDKMKVESTGKAKTVLVFGEGEDAVAVTSSVIVRAYDERQGHRLAFTGTATFDGKIVKHFSDVVLPLIDSICSLLDVKPKQFEISAANIGAAAAMDIGTVISGFSADVPLFLALLSASLCVPVAEDIVSTGHIASNDGAIRLVKNIPTKVAAAASDPLIRSFIYPALDADISLDMLSPNEKEHATAALCQAKLMVRTIPVSNIRELVEAAFSEEAVVQASLRAGFFIAPPPDSSLGQIADTTRFFAEDIEQRFTTVLERHLLGGESTEARDLLDACMQFHIRRKKYPCGFGKTLLRLIRSLPPSVRRLKIRFPLLRIRECIKVTQFASESDYEDVQSLYAATNPTDTIQLSVPPTAVSQHTRQPPQTEEGTFDTVLSEVDRDNMARTIGLPIDAARASYVMDSILVQSNDEFMTNISAFHLHLCRHIGTISEAVDPKAVEAEAYALLERAFAKRGGVNAAHAEGKTGTRGGMRFVFDCVADELKAEKQRDHLLRIYKSAISPLDWDAKVAFINIFVKRHEAELSPDIISAPPERFANRWEDVVSVYVQGISRVKEVLRAM